LISGQGNCREVPSLWKNNDQAEVTPSENFGLVKLAR
jgi:hypothetical protein